LPGYNRIQRITHVGPIHGPYTGQCAFPSNYARCHGWKARSPVLVQFDEVTADLVVTQRMGCPRHIPGLQHAWVSTVRYVTKQAHILDLPQGPPGRLHKHRTGKLEHYTWEAVGHSLNQLNV
jgi:hypothetical protein